MEELNSGRLEYRQHGLSGEVWFIYLRENFPIHDFLHGEYWRLLELYEADPEGLSLLALAGKDELKLQRIMKRRERDRQAGEGSR
jgi:hypothetical protein